MHICGQEDTAIKFLKDLEPKQRRPCTRVVKQQQQQRTHTCPLALFCNFSQHTNFNLNSVHTQLRMV